eukprot:scaffold5209_cov106-Isochrysis_galbana.AAC.3
MITSRSTGRSSRSIWWSTTFVSSSRYVDPMSRGSRCGSSRYGEPVGRSSRRYCCRTNVLTCPRRVRFTNTRLTVPRLWPSDAMWSTRHDCEWCTVCLGIWLSLILSLHESGVPDLFAS